MDLFVQSVILNQISFGRGTCEELAEQYNTQVLGLLPIEPAIREGGDGGKPVVYFKPESESAKRYMQATEKLLQFVDANSDKAENASIQPTTNGVSACSTSGAAASQSQAQQQSSGGCGTGCGCH